MLTFEERLKIISEKKIEIPTRSETFYDFVQKYQSMIYNVCLRLIGNRQDAEDIAQDVFVKAFEYFESYKGDAHISTWLYRIAVNLSLNFIKRRKRIRWLTLDFTASPGETESFPEPHADEQPETDFEQKEINRVIQRAIHQLPEKQKTAFVLHKLEGLSHQKISEILNIPVTSVESRIHRAKQTLQKALIPVLKNDTMMQ